MGWKHFHLRVPEYFVCPQLWMSKCLPQKYLFSCRTPRPEQPPGEKVFLGSLFGMSFCMCTYVYRQKGVAEKLKLKFRGNEGVGLKILPDLDTETRIFRSLVRCLADRSTWLAAIAEVLQKFPFDANWASCGVYVPVMSSSGGCHTKNDLRHARLRYEEVAWSVILS